jgi:hypothetical protein
MDVYNRDAFEDRVNYAASVIGTGTIPLNGRCFDTCFEMNDGEYVIAALVRRTLKNPSSRLADNLFRVLSEDRARQCYEQTKHLTRKELRLEALRIASERNQALGV